MKISEILVKRLKRLRKGDQVEINGKIYSITGRKYHQTESEDDSDSMIFELDDNFVLTIEWDLPNLCKVIEKKGWFLVPTMTTKWRNIKIEDIKIIN